MLCGVPPMLHLSIVPEETTLGMNICDILFDGQCLVSYVLLLGNLCHGPESCCPQQGLL